MQQTGNEIMQRDERLTIRVGENSLCFAFDKDGNENFEFVPYKTKNGISMAANLREAIKDENLNIGKWRKVQVLIDSPAIMVPIDEYNEQNKELQYNYSITGQENNAVLATILPMVNAVALYALNKDLRLVLTDNFHDIKIHPVCGNVWQYLQKRSQAGANEKMYCYFHDGKMEVCSFRKNRFRFANAFQATHPSDVTYFLLAVWKQLEMNAEKDDIYLLGNYADYEELTENLKHYVNNVYRIKASADFNRHPLTQIKDIPFDLVATLLK